MTQNWQNYLIDYMNSIVTLYLVQIRLLIETRIKSINDIK